MSTAQLQQALIDQQPLHHHDVERLANLWRAYQQNDTTSLLAQAEQLQADLPFVLPAVTRIWSAFRQMEHPAGRSNRCKQLWPN